MTYNVSSGTLSLYTTTTTTTTLCIGGFFPVIHSWSFVHQSSICRVVDMLYAVSYTVAEYEWIFSSLL